MSLTDSIAQAIATYEGYYQSGSLAARNNNPGNLRTWGNTPVVDGFARFDTPAAGWSALVGQIELNISRGLSLGEFFGGKPGVYPGYAPAADDNQPAAYAQYVAGRVGVPVDIPLSPGFFLPRIPVPAGMPAAGDDLLLVAGLVGAVSLLILL